MKSSFENTDEIEIKRFIGILIDYKWFITGVVSVFTVVGIIYTLLSTPIYRTDALVQVEKNAGSSLLKNITSVLPDSKPESDAEVELIKSRMVIGKTVDDLSLDTVVSERNTPFIGNAIDRVFGSRANKVAISRLEVPSDWYDRSIRLVVISNSKYKVVADDVEFLGEVGKLNKNEGFILLVSDIKSNPGVEFNVEKASRISAINNVLDNLTVNDKGKDSGIIQLTYEGSNPTRINKVLNTIAKNYLRQNVERKSEEAGKSLDFLKQQLPGVRESLNIADDKLNLFRQENDSVDLSLEAKSLLDTMVAIDTQLNELTFKEAEISKLYTKEHPAYRALLEKRTTLEEEKERINKKVNLMPKTQQEILRLTRDLQAEQEVYLQLLNKQQELSINKASTVGNVRIIDQAVSQPKPVKPRKSLIIVLSILLGLGVSIAYLLVKRLLNKGVDNPEQLEALGINVYASVPISEWQKKKDSELSKKKKSRNTRSVELLALGNPTDLAIEAIRSLRTSLHFAMMEAKNNVLMISGASPGIGKTFISANLSVIIAQAGKTVLLVDCDMRKGYLHEILQHDNHVGLSDILSNQTTLSEAVKDTTVSGMDMISRGKIPPNPSELLMHEKFSEFIQWASKNYDMVILDTPPILAVTDAAVISKQVGTSLLVARYELNSVKEIEVSIRRFEQNGAEIKGVIINGLIKRAQHSYTGYDYYLYEYKENKK